MENSIAARIELIEEKIEAACRRSGRPRHEVKLMAVTKFRPLEDVESVCKAGVKLFGESRIQEGTDKFSKFWETHQRDGSVELHFIGSLQRNKAKKAASFFDCIQSVDRDSLLEELGALSTEKKPHLNIMLEYRTGEDTKSGFTDMDSLFKAAEKLLSFPGLYPLGLMTMAPFTNDEAAIRLSFRKLVSLREELKKRFASEEKHWSCLSMGMTNDYEIAIEEGSSLIRVGTAIFG
jgi:hypothetical protein